MRKRLVAYYMNYRKRFKSLGPAARRRVALLVVALLASMVLVCVGLTTGGAAWMRRTSDAPTARRQTPMTKNSSLLYECELSYLQMDLSLIKFSINYLELDEPNKQQNSSLNDTFKLVDIDYNSTVEELANKTRLDTKLPFVFFINGFNTFAPYDGINDTWMFDVARSFARRSVENESEASSSQAPARSRVGSFISRIGRFLRATVHGTRATSRDEHAPDFKRGRNVIFLTWSIPDLFTSNLFAMIPAYYKTVANYDLIVDYVAGTMLKLIALVERTSPFKTAESRAAYYSQFQFYGHSLGSHILSDAILRVVKEISESADAPERDAPPPRPFLGSNTRPAAQVAPLNASGVIKFGKLMGLDPASPCFVSNEYGISSTKVNEAVGEVVVLHSNAGFAGIPNERADLEIVLNGGTFQPGCVWYDFTCSHVRSTDILNYVDDECQMVAYKCTTYNHFKQGACETCDKSRLAKSEASLGRNCVLVNLPEQHRDQPHVLAYVEQLAGNTTRQLADSSPSAELTPSQQFDWLLAIDSLDRTSLQRLGNNSAGPEAPAAKTKKAYFHHVNTNANFRFGRKSHCLQHYQLRLLIYNTDANLREKCKPSAFYVKSSDEIKLKLFYEVAEDLLADERTLLAPSSRQSSWSAPRFLRRFGLGAPEKSAQVEREVQRKRPKLVEKMLRDSDDPRLMVSQIKLGAVLKDIFHTGLVNFEAGPKLFVGAQLVNLDLEALGECYRRENATGGPNFVLDVAFMSHTDQKIRNAFSSVLCGQLELPAISKQDRPEEEKASSGESVYRNDAAPSLGHDLMLNLCKQSELKNVSAEIDQLLSQIKLHLLDETWKVSLLNSLFSLFTEWEPF